MSQKTPHTTHLIGIAESPGSLDLDNLEPGCTTQLLTHSRHFPGCLLEQTHILSVAGKKGFSWRQPRIVGTVPHPSTCSSQKLWGKGYFSEPFFPNHVSRTTKLGVICPTGNNLSVKVYYKFITTPTN